MLAGNIWCVLFLQWFASSELLCACSSCALLFYFRLDAGKGSGCLLASQQKMPQQSLSPPSDLNISISPTLRQVATAPNLRLHFGLPFKIEAESPITQGETPTTNSFASKFNPFHHSQFRTHLSNTQLSASPPKSFMDYSKFRSSAIKVAGYPLRSNFRKLS